MITLVLIPRQYIVINSYKKKLYFDIFELIQVIMIKQNLKRTKNCEKFLKEERMSL